MRNIILAVLASVLLVGGAMSADARGHRGGGHPGGGHHGGRHWFHRFPRCHIAHGWHNGHYVTTRLCKTSFRQW